MAWQPPCTLALPSLVQEGICITREEHTDAKNRIFECTFPAAYQYSKILRDTVSGMLANAGAESRWCRRFALVVDELVNNAIEHGSAEGDIIEVSVQIAAQDTGMHVVLCVCDAGHGPHAKSAEEMNTLRDTKVASGFDHYLGNRGRGLFQIITTLADSLEFSARSVGGLCVRVEKYFTLEPKDTSVA